MSTQRASSADPDPDGFEIVTTRRGNVRHLRHKAWGLRTACGHIVSPEDVAARDAPGAVTAGCRSCARSFRGKHAAALLGRLGRHPFPLDELRRDA